MDQKNQHTTSPSDLINYDYIFTTPKENLEEAIKEILINEFENKENLKR